MYEDELTNRRNNLNVLSKRYTKKVDFADAIGLSPSHAYQCLTGKRPIGEKVARKIEKSIGIERGWLDLPHRDGLELAGMLKNYSDGPEIKGRYPLISWVNAGNWGEIVDNFEPGDADEWLPCPVNCSDSTFILRVKGVSMEPRFHDGELIFVDPEAEYRNGAFVVVRLDDAEVATFKQLIEEGGRRYLKAINPAWPEPIIEVNGNATICGTVIFKGEVI